jgi:transcriptional regulator with XRE-family HTH domain
VDVCLVIKQRLEQLGFEQKDLAAATEVTESYISQLLTRKKLPPAPDRTDIYDKMGKFLKLSSGKLAKLAELQRREALKRNFEDPPAPLFHEVRELVIRKCAPGKQQQIRAIFEKQPFGELERLVTQKLLDVSKQVAREELKVKVAPLVADQWPSYKQMRVMILEFRTQTSSMFENCVSFPDPPIDSWVIDL